MSRRIVLAGFALFMPFAAHAIVPPTPCTGLIGCGGGPANLVAAAVPKVAVFMIALAAGLGVLFIALAGLQMVIALGNDSKLTEQKHAAAYVLGGLAIVIMAQLLVSVAGTQIYGQGAAAMLPQMLIGSAISIVLTMFNAVFTIAIIIGGMRMVYAQGKADEYNTARKIIFWSIIGAIVVNLSNALVQALARIFGA
jgi:hypothetical protein